jgi:hypothetical protein
MQITPAQQIWQKGVTAFVLKPQQLPSNIPNRRKLCQHPPLQDPPKFNQIDIFRLKMHHLATPFWRPVLFISFKFNF